MKQIIVVRPHDNWVSIKLSNWCAEVQDVPATLKVVTPGCPEEVKTCAPSPCAPCPPCALPLWTTTIVEPPSVTLTSSEYDCGGFKFALTPAFRELGLGRFEAEITACGKTAALGIQIVDLLKIADTGVGYDFETVPFVVDGETVGELAVLNKCAIPTGWVAVRNTNNTIAGYGRAMKSLGFCKEYRLTQCKGRVIYLK